MFDYVNVGLSVGSAGSVEICRHCERPAVSGGLCEFHADDVRSCRERSIRHIGCRRRRPKGEWDQGSGSFDDVVKVIEG